MKLDFVSAFIPLLGIDCGTSRIKLWSSKEAVFLDQASCIAVEVASSRVIAVGDEAAAMSGRVGGDIQVSWPIVRGEVAEPDLALAMLRVLIRQAFPSMSFIRPTIMLSVPAGLTPAKRQLTTELFHQLGAREVISISQSLAAAIGSGVPIADASGTFLVQMGAGLVEASIISLGKVVVSHSTYLAGMTIDQHIQELVARQYGLGISLKTAAMLKQEVAACDGRERSQLASGQDTVVGSPKEVMITSQDLEPLMSRLVEQYVHLLERVLSAVPPELTVDVIDKGLLLSGGLAQLAGLDAALVQRLGVPVTGIEAPTQAVVKGLATALGHVQEFKNSLSYVSV
jgi:rod shape-determining protein MreB